MQASPATPATDPGAALAATLASARTYAAALEDKGIARDIGALTDAVERLTASPAQSLVRLRIRGRVIDAQGGESGVVHLVVRTDKQHPRLLGRLRQHLANALFCAGDLCNPGHDHRALRVDALVVPGQTLDDQLTDLAHAHRRELVALNGPNGDAHYNALFVHERVEHHHKGIGGKLLAVFGLQKRTDDAHGRPLQAADFSNWDTVIVLPQQGGAA